ncbi:MAG: pentapeptide repeat-containing protein, partial [Verrucomicrobiales bacterium]|nr:pentapeptide repeat-containing protein [Verrucomicrobiales bacterium]
MSAPFIPRVHLLLVLQLVLLRCAALTNLPLQVSQNADQIVVSWNAKSTVPQNMPVVPDYYLEVSNDLQTWELLQSYRSNAAPRRITRALPRHQEDAQFFRLRSVLDLSGRSFFRAFMARADFANARMVGADFFAATLTAARFADSDLTGTDFRSATMPGSDFRRATAFAASLAGANLRGSDLRGA